MLESKIDTVYEHFTSKFQKTPLMVRSPGRINLIGEHTDYNQGFVLPAAVDKAIIFAVSPNSSNLYRFYSVDMDENTEVPSGDLKKSQLQWANYLLGVIDQINKMGYEVPGFDCVFGGNIPIGAGLSSSAALEAGLAFSLNHIFQWVIEKMDLVKLSQKAENEFAGVRCGIMDQFTNIYGAFKKVIKLDCRSLEYEYYPFDYKEFSIVLYDTRVSHSLASSEYNKRRSQCEEGVHTLQKHNPDIKSLRDVDLEFLETLKNKMNPVIYKRCHYVVSENKRLLSACEDLRRKDLKSFGSKMYQTHQGLKNDYEVSCQELDFLVQKTMEQEAVLGARMMGGGFGGCTINLIRTEALDEFNAQMEKDYFENFNKKLGLYKIKIEKGTHVI